MMTRDCVCLQGWGKGVIFINGKNLGRYWSIGPQQTLYVPGPWLHKGDNQVLLYYLYLQVVILRLFSILQWHNYLFIKVLPMLASNPILTHHEKWLPNSSRHFL